MAKSYKTPGVYIEEISKFPPSIAAAESAVPVFIGFTEKDEHDGKSLVNKTFRISSLLEFETIFGKPKPQHISVLLDSNNQLAEDVIVDPLLFRIYYSLKLFFDNGGGNCYICSAGIYPANIEQDTVYTALSDALAAAATEQPVTIIVLIDAQLAGEDSFYSLYREALQQAATLQNRFVIVDIFTVTQQEPFHLLEENFREKIGNDHLKYGAAYYPYLQTVYSPFVEEEKENIVIGEQVYKLRLPDSAAADELVHSLFHVNPALYNAVKNSIQKTAIVLPPSAAIAGIYCRTDNTRGVWKAPANISLDSVIKPMVQITDQLQADMNVHHTGKSVNAIRSFPGKGVMVWGARTLAGNDNEWRYIPVTRFFSQMETSIQAAVENFVFEPNDGNTWIRVRAMVENFLTLQWRSGALQGNRPEHAFYVKIGLNETMNTFDILEGRMILEIGMAVVRPAEFIITKFVFAMSVS